MLRPPALRIVGDIECPQCNTPVKTLYACEHEGAVNVEVVTIKCKCGYEYVARGRHGQAQ